MLLIYTSAILGLGAILLLSRGTRNFITRRFGGFGYAIYLFSGLQFVVPIFFWCFGVLPPLNMADSPIMLGSAGVYGTEVPMLVRTSFLMSLYGISTMLFLYGLAWAYKPLKFAEVLWYEINEDRLKTLGWLIAGGYMAMFFLLYTVVGWDRLFLSSIGRLTGEEDVGFFAIIVNGRVYNAVTLLAGLTSVLMTYRRSTRSAGCIVLFLCLCYSYAQASRMVPVLLLGFTAVQFVVQSRRVRRIWIVVLGVICIPVSYLMVLNARSSPELGLLTFPTMLKEVIVLGDDSDSDEVGSLRALVIKFSQNLGQGVGVFAEAVTIKTSGGNPLSGLPAEFVVLSLSPTPSLIDGYAVKYGSQVVGVNINTPFSAASELYFIGAVVPPIFYTLMGLGFMHMARRFSGMRVTGRDIGFFVILIYLLVVVQGFQYNLRTTTRFMYYGGMLLPILEFGVMRFFHAYRPWVGTRNRCDVDEDSVPSE